MHTRNLLAALASILLTSTACTSSPTAADAGTDGGTTSGPVVTTTCTPTLAPGFFDGATNLPSQTYDVAPCPSGTTSPLQGVAFTSPQRFTTEADFVATFCQTTGDAGAADAGAVDAGDAGAVDAGASPVDFSSFDLVALRSDVQSPLQSVGGGDLWANASTGGSCGGATMSHITFYAVPKGKLLNVESCTSTCACPAGNCPG